MVEIELLAHLHREVALVFIIGVLGDYNHFVVKPLREFFNHCGLA
jgi:hypothetical protein